MALCQTALSCAPTVCDTKCGVAFIGMVDGSEPPEAWNCEALQYAEDRAVYEFKFVKNNGVFPAACHYINGYRLWVYPTETFVSTWDSKSTRAGETYCGTKRIFVGNRPPLESAFSHELAHAVEDCRDPDHEFWGADGGINEAIERARY